MAMRGVRGATTVDSNEREEIIAKTGEMIQAVIERNNINVEDIASAIFSVTDDIDDEFPAVAARNIGWLYTPLLCTKEIPVKGSLQGCIRVLLHINSDLRQDEIIHVYLHGAKKLRPDLDRDVDKKYYISDVRE
jgi:chorismate mutase